MNKKSFLIFLIVALVITNLLMATFILLGKKGKHEKRHNPKEMVIKKLNFDEDQTKAFEVMIEDHHSKIEERHEEIKNLKEVCYSYLNENQNNLKVNTVTRQIGEKVSAIEMLNYQHFLDIKSICREDQLKDYEKLTTEIGKMFGPHPKKKR